VARQRSRIERAAALHRQAGAALAAAGRALDGYSPVGAATEQHAEQRDLAGRLRTAAQELAPGWLGADLDALADTTPLGGHVTPAHVRIAMAHPLDDARFPVVVPLLGAGHLAIDADARDPRAAGLLRSLVLRLLAAAPAGALRVRVVDTAWAGTTFAQFHGIDAVLPPPATDRIGLREVLSEAERWSRRRPAIPTGQAGDNPDIEPVTEGGPILLVVIASLPELTEGSDLLRIAALAQTGPAARLHVVVAGWPPPPLTAETTQPPLPLCTQITLRNPYSWVGDPPGGTFAAPAALGPGMPGRLNAPAYLDPDPPAELVRRVCDHVAAQLAERARLGSDDLLGVAQWSPSAIDPPAGSYRGDRSVRPRWAVPRSAWQEYLATAQRLDLVRRATAAMVAEQAATLRTAQGELASVRSRLALQQPRLIEAAREAGVPAPVVAPTPAEFAGTALPGTPEEIRACVRAARSALDASDAALAEDDVAPESAVLRNLGVYGGYAVVLGLIEAVSGFLLLGHADRRLWVLGFCGVPVSSLVTFGLGWATIGFLPRPPGAKAIRTPLLGAVASLLTLAPWFFIAIWTAVAAFTRR